jgi:hypothetical protein
MAVTPAATSMRGTDWRSSGTMLPIPSAMNESCVAMKFSIAPFMWCARHHRASAAGASASRHMFAPKPKPSRARNIIAYDELRNP